MISRADNSPFARWWWTVDRPAFIAVMMLMFIGLVLAFAPKEAVLINRQLVIQ